MHTSRRSFLAQAALAPLILPSLRGQAAPGERITTALIGHGVMGRGHLRVLASRPESQLLAMCDVDRTRRNDAVAQVPGITACNDYRELLARDDIDAVVVVTPDHWHSQISIEAARAGKDVYCEKPVSLTVREGRQLAETVTRYARVFQTGTQYRSIPTIRRVCQFVRDGGLGKVKSVYTMWGKGSRFPGANPYIPVPDELPGQPVPDYLDWDLWLGPAPWRPYNRAFHRNPRPGVVPWVFCSDFGAGAVTGYHSHAADVIQYAIGMETSGPVAIHHPKDGNFPTLTCEYGNGVLLHLVQNWGMVKSVYHAVPDDARLAGNFGGVFVGERGWVTSMTTGGPVEGGPDGLFQRMRLRSRDVNTGDNTHYSNWFECVRNRRRPSSHEEIGHRSASLGHLTIIAYQLGRSLKWDPVREVFPEDPQANRLLSRARREPYLL
jgi:predicted dehydrogenase